MTSALMSAIRFTEADLQANRQDALSQAQVERIYKSRRRHTAIAAILFVTLVIAATGLIFAGQRNHNQILSGAGVLLIALNAILVGIMGRTFMRVGSDLRAGSVVKLTGQVERVVRRGRQGDNYLIRIDGASLSVTKEVFLGFRHQSPYRIYRTAHGGLLLSAEPLE